MKFGILGCQRISHSELHWVQSTLNSCLPQNETVIRQSSLIICLSAYMGHLLAENRVPIEIAVVPSVDFASTLVGVDRDAYDRLLARSEEVFVLDFIKIRDAAIRLARQYVVDSCDMLIVIRHPEYEIKDETEAIVHYAISVSRPMMSISISSKQLEFI